MNHIYIRSRKLKKLNLTQSDIDHLNQIEYSNKNLTLLVKAIVKNYNFGLSMEHLSKNWNKIVALGRDSSSLEAYIIRYGKEFGEKYFQEKIQKTTCDTQYYVALYGVEKAKEQLRLRGASEQIYIERLGEELGKQRWQEYLVRREMAYVKNRKNGYEYAKYNREYYHNLHGIEKGNEIYDKKIAAQAYKVSLAYYIEKFGAVNGPEKCRENKDHLSISYFIKKHGKDLGTEKYTEYWENFRKNNGSMTRSKISKWSMEVVDELLKVFPDLIQYGNNEKSFILCEGDNLIGYAIYPDLVYNDKIIEFNGDLFHANPKIFEKDEHPHPFDKEKTSKDIWQHDALRKMVFEKAEFKVLEIWNSDWIDDKEGVLEKCVKHLKS